jgi:hypothetical protein
METIEGRTMHDEIIRMDEKCFVGCTLIHCTLEYGGGPVILERTQLTGCRYVFFGKAKASIDFLQCVGLMSRVDPRWEKPNQPELLSSLN